MNSASFQSVNTVARDAAQVALRSYGEATAGLRAMRRPSSSLSGQNAAVLRRFTITTARASGGDAAVSPVGSTSKGFRYFDSEYSRGRRWYRSHFPMEMAGRYVARPWVANPVTGEASPYYLFHPLAAARLARELPDVRLIVSLRDPV